MKFGVLGTGMVGLAISRRLAELGHEVMIGAREPSQIGQNSTSLQRAVVVPTDSVRESTQSSHSH